ncbi:trypsin-like peptidase domain-containing protein [Kurthia sibirica]|nr:trypsin-like peptidase domain-containing protein [Kurthia sibirica]GEK35626.1 hypothetical protein KSI01_31590 [Kurthia sibirica]
MSEKKRYKPKKAAVKRFAVAFILIIAVVGGVYALLTKNDGKENAPNTVKVQNEEKNNNTNEQAKDDGKEKEEPSDKETGKVTNETPKTEPSEGTTNKAETTVVMPTYDKDAIIANAKTQVYTVYTDLQQGSGFLVNQKGDILTNAHVAKDAGFVVVKNQHGQEFQGEVIGISTKTDIALIRVPDLAGKNPLVLDSATAAVGTKVVAIGSPKDQYGTTTEGIVKSIGAEFVDGYTYNHLYEITAKLNKGSSGGPLINAETGNVIGINSIILEDHPEVGYAIPISSVLSFINTWSAKNPTINFDDNEDFDNNHADEAYFSNKLLKDSMESYYLLVAQTLNSGKHDYYSSYLLENSKAVATAKTMIDTYSSKTKQFKNIKYNVTGITIGEASSTVNMKTVVTYIDTATKKQQTVTENLTYTIIIDDFGEYMISSIVINNSVDTGDQQVVEPPVTEDKAPDESTDTSGNGTTEEEKPPVEDNDADTDTNGSTSKPIDQGEAAEDKEEEKPATDVTP